MTCSPPMAVQSRVHAFRAAAELTRRRGWDVVSLVSVAAACGVEPAVLAAEFGDRDGLGSALLDWWFEALTATTVAAPEQTATPDGALVAVLVEIALTAAGHMLPLVAQYRCGGDLAAAREQLAGFLTTSVRRVAGGVSDPDGRAESVVRLVSALFDDRSLGAVRPG